MKARLTRGRRTGAGLVVAAVAAAAMLTGCGSSGGGASSASPTITVWSWRSQDAPLWNTVSKDTGVKIDFRAITPTSYDSVLQTAMNGGSGPDIFYDRANVGTKTYGAAHLAAPLDNIVNFSGVNKTALAAAQYQGKTYGVPFAIQTMELFYNKDLLAKDKLPVPTTWSSLVSDMKALKSKGVTPMSVMGTQQWLLALDLEAIEASSASNQWNQELVDKKASFTGQPYVAAEKAFQQLEPYFESNWQGVGSAGNEQETDFALGKAAFIIDGIFDTAQINQVNPNLNYGQELVPSPDGQSSKIDWYVDGNISMNAKIGNAAEKAAAQKVIKFTATKQFGNAFSDIAGEISPIAGVKIPAKYTLSTQAYNWFQTVPAAPVIGINSQLDTTPINPETLKSKKAAVSDDQGIFAAQQTDIDNLLLGKISAEQESAKLQSDLKWYFGQ